MPDLQEQEKAQVIISNEGRHLEISASGAVIKADEPLLTLEGKGETRRTTTHSNLNPSSSVTP